jgi:transcriptional regulator GlxA family with amidase domain
MAYLTKLRVEIAASLLHDTYLDIADVMTKVGFRDTSHFGRIFNKFFGCSPSQYRKSYLTTIYSKKAMKNW